MYKSFEDAEKDYYEFWYGEKKDSKKAIEIAKYCLENYADHKNQIIMDLIIFYGESKEIDKCKKMMRIGFENDIWYPKEFFSEGATLSMDFAFNLSELAASGYIALNPDRPASLSSEKIRSLRENTLRGSIITGDMDSCFADQLSMIKDFKSIKFPCKFHITKNFGHWFPEDLAQLIDESIDYIDGKI